MNIGIKEVGSASTYTQPRLSLSDVYTVNFGRDVVSAARLGSCRGDFLVYLDRRCLMEQWSLSVWLVVLVWGVDDCCYLTWYLLGLLYASLIRKS